MALGAPASRRRVDDRQYNLAGETPSLAAAGPRVPRSAETSPFQDALVSPSDLSRNSVPRFTFRPNFDAFAREQCDSNERLILLFQPFTTSCIEAARLGTFLAMQTFSVLE